MNSNYDTSWDLVETEEGILPVNENAFEDICQKWTKRSWEAWLTENLSFPFVVRRTDDEDDAYFTDVADREPFRLGHEMKVIGIEQEDDLYGIKPCLRKTTFPWSVF